MKIKVMIASHFGEPWGGISIQNDILQTSVLKDHVNLLCVKTSAGKLGFVSRGKFSISSILSSFINISNFVKEFNRFQPDLVDIGTAYGPSFYKHSIMVIYTKLHKKKVVITFHCSYKKIFSGKFFQDLFARTLLQIVDGVNIISQEWLSLKKSCPHLKLRYIPNAIDTHQFTNLQRIEKSFVSIIYLGYIGEQKGIWDLVDAVSILSTSNRCTSLRVNLVGEELEKGSIAKVENLIYRKNLKEIITIHPFASGNEKFEYLEKADIMVLPSHHEGMPISIIEGMAAGLPIIATNIGGIPDLVIQGKTGLLVEPRNHIQLAKAINELVCDPELRKKMGVAGRKKAINEFDINIKAEKLLLSYRDMLGK